jgi:hypothetical protein
VVKPEKKIMFEEVVKKPPSDYQESFTLGYLLGTLAVQHEARGKADGKKAKKKRKSKKEAGRIQDENSIQTHDTKIMLEEIVAKGMQGQSLKSIVQTLKKNPKQQPRLARGYLTYVLMQFAAHSDTLDSAALQQGFQKRLDEAERAERRQADRARAAIRGLDIASARTPPRCHVNCSPLHCGMYMSKDSDLEQLDKFDSLIIAVESSLASLRNESLSMQSSVDDSSSDLSYRFTIPSEDSNAAASLLSDIESWFAFLSDSASDDSDERSEKSDSSFEVDVSGNVLRV